MKTDMVTTLMSVQLDAGNRILLLLFPGWGEKMPDRSFSLNDYDKDEDKS